MDKTNTGVAGIDTGKAKLDVVLGGSGTHFEVSNDAAGFELLVRRLAASGIGRVGLEASGGYEREVMAALRQGGFTVLRHQPGQVRLYARMGLQQAKNDRLDAGVIAAFTALDLSRERPDYGLDALNDHLVYIEQLGQDIARLKTRLDQQRDPRLAAQIAQDIAGLIGRQRAERRHLERRVRAAPDLGRRLDLVLSIPGIGLPTALSLIVSMPELGHIGRQQAVSLIGLAPFDHDSGQHRGIRHIRGGRARPRKALYAAALPAAFKWNPALKAFYTRLIAKGKAHKQALVACARKLLIYANTVLARNSPWQTQTNGCSW